MTKEKGQTMIYKTYT